MSLTLPAVSPAKERSDEVQQGAASSGSMIFLAAGSESHGIERCFLSLNAALTRRGQPPTFALLSRGSLHTALESRGISVIYAPISDSVPKVTAHGWRKVLQVTRRVANQMRSAPWLTRQVRDRSTDTIVVQSPLEVFLAAFVAWRTGITAYWMMPNLVSSGYPLDINRRIYRFMFRHMNLVPIANSHYTNATLGDGDYERHVVHLGIDMAAFSPDQPTTLCRQDLGLPPDAVVLGIFARMVPEKGQQIVAEAIALLGEAGSNIHLLLCGGPLDNPFALQLRARIDELGLSKRVHMAGQIDDVAPYYPICDVIVNCRTDPEPFGLSVIEGMAMGKPILAHRAGGPGETVIDAVTGWLVDEPTPEAFAAALHRMLADRLRWPTMSRAAREHVVTNFSDDRMLADLSAVFSA